jgi:serine protease Do
MNDTIFNSKNPLVKTIAISAVVSALVGSVFGYYGAHINGTGSSVVSGINASDESSLVVAIAKDNSPAVVSIVASQAVTVNQRRSPYQAFCDDPFFRQFFGNCDSPQTQTPQSQEVAAGSGFIVTTDGLIVTNKHVIDISGATFTVITSDGKKYTATIKAQDPVQDIAILKIDAKNLPIANLGNSDDVEVGETVLAIGNALGQFSNTVSKGIISGLYRTIVAGAGNSSEQLDRVIQTDAAINPGNSGGPLLNVRGQVIGMNTAVASDAQNVGFALPINRVKKDLADIQAAGKISYPFLGVQYVLIDAEIQTEHNLSTDHGAWVSKGPDGNPAVVAGSPAEKAGLQENDIILSVDNTPIDQKSSLADIIQSKQVGDKITLLVSRDGREITLTATLAEKK